MSKTIKEVAEIVEQKGLCFTIYNLISHENIENHALAAKWKLAKETLDEINEIIFPDAD